MPCGQARTVGVRFGERQMRRLGFSPRGMVHCGPSSSQEDRSLAGFEELAIPLFDSLYNFARWLAQNQNDAEDLVQETYLKAFRSFASFQPGTNFRAWIFRILRNTFLSSCPVRERQLMVELESEEQVFPAFANCTTPESLLIDSSSIAAIRDAIQQLPTIYREVILLCD